VQIIGIDYLHIVFAAYCPKVLNQDTLAIWGKCGLEGLSNLRTTFYLMKWAAAAQSFIKKKFQDIFVLNATYYSS